MPRQWTILMITDIKPVLQTKRDDGKALKMI